MRNYALGSFSKPWRVFAGKLGARELVKNALQPVSD